MWAIEFVERDYTAACLDCVDVAGTTTDPVEKPMELLPLGPVLFIDTAGSTKRAGGRDWRVGRVLASWVALRWRKTRQALERTEIAVLVASRAFGGSSRTGLLADFAERQTPAVVVINKTDAVAPDAALVERLRGRKMRVVLASAITGVGLPELREALLELAPGGLLSIRRRLSATLVGPGELAVLVGSDRQKRLRREG